VSDRRVLTVFPDHAPAPSGNKGPAQRRPGFHTELLAEVERHIAEAELRIARQVEIVGRLAGAVEAEASLWSTERSLGLMRQHRRLLLRLLGHEAPEE
jgi:hypothetical protein